MFFMDYLNRTLTNLSLNSYNTLILLEQLIYNFPISLGFFRRVYPQTKLFHKYIQGFLAFLVCHIESKVDTNQYKNCIAECRGFHLKQNGSVQDNEELAVIGV